MNVRVCPRFPNQVHACISTFPIYVSLGPDQFYRLKIAAVVSLDWLEQRACLPCGSVAIRLLLVAYR